MGVGRRVEIVFCWCDDKKRRQCEMLGSWELPCSRYQVSVSDVLVASEDRPRLAGNSTIHVRTTFMV